MKFLISLILLVVVVSLLEAARPKARNGVPLRQRKHLGGPRHPNRQSLSKHSPKHALKAPSSHSERKQSPLTNVTHPNPKFPRKLKEFAGSGPFSYDYLIGENEYIESDYEVIFIDNDTEQDLIQKYIDAGKILMCYVNVGAWEDWRSDAADFPDNVLGNDYEGWPGEKWLDIRELDVLLPIMRARFQVALDKGCQGIDPDNMNGYSVDSGFVLSYDDQINYNVAIAEEIRSLGMVSGLKNDNDQAADLVDASDFVVLEQCAAYNECSPLDVFITNDKPVFAIEYTDEWAESDFENDVCPLVDETGMSFILKNLNLHGDYIVSCL